MRQSRLFKMLAGIFIICIGLGLFLENLGIIKEFHLFPFVLFFLGIYYWNKNRKFVGGTMFFIGAAIASENWFGIDLFALLFPMVIIYSGFRLLRSRHESKGSSSNSEWMENEPSSSTVFNEPHNQTVGKGYDKSFTYGPSRQAFASFGKTSEAYDMPNQVFSSTEMRKSLVGDFHLTTGRFEMHNLHIWHGVGDVLIDLSRALLPEEENFLVVNGWVGDITIYVPIDLPVSVSADLKVGEMDILGLRQSGLNRQVRMATKQYDSSGKKVKIIISLLVGDIDVKYI